jgi:hypothetical protein
MIKTSTSVISKLFAIIISDEVYCTNCGMQFETQMGSLATLKDHLKQNHLDLWMELISTPRLIKDNHQQAFESSDLVNFSPLFS